MDKKLILREIKKHLGYTKDGDFADFLGIKQNTLSNWKSRNTIDYDLIISKCENIDANWLLTGKGEMLKSPAKQESHPQQAAEPIAIYQKAPIPPVPSHWERQVASLQKEVAYLQRENQHLQEWLKDKDKVIKALEEKESTRIQELEEEIARLTQENHAIKSQPQ
ncbi:helix-turn-helix domain-containing protein, partial [Ornithobacterium rhinotracheale]